MFSQFATASVDLSPLPMRSSKNPKDDDDNNYDSAVEYCKHRTITSLREDDDDVDMAMMFGDIPENDEINFINEEEEEEEELEQENNNTAEDEAGANVLNDYMAIILAEDGGMKHPPPNTTVEDDLSSALMKLSMNHRSAMEEEIHGVSCFTPFGEETSELIAKSLYEFDIELLKVKKRRRRNNNKRHNNNNKFSTVNDDDDNIADVLRNTIWISGSRGSGSSGVSDSGSGVVGSRSGGHNRDHHDCDDHTNTRRKDRDAHNYTPVPKKRLKTMEGRFDSGIAVGEVVGGATSFWRTHQEVEQGRGGGGGSRVPFTSTSTSSSTIPTFPPRTTPPPPSNDNLLKDCYLNDPNIRLRFLRSEFFDSQKAVERFVLYLEFIQELFGDFVAERPISVNDFNDTNTNSNNNDIKKSTKTKKEKSQKRKDIEQESSTEMKALLNSRLQYLPFRDRSGRRVCIFVGAVLMNIETVLRYKVIMYLHWIASEDIETQQKGVVLICWPSLESDYTTGLSGGGCREREVNASSSNTEQTSIWDKYFTPDKKEIVENKGYDVSLSYHKKSFLTPIRFSSVHFCGQNIPALRLISSIFYFGLPNNIDLKSRYKSHFGEPIELRYQLQGYGIPVDLLPLTFTGVVKTTYHSQCVKFRKKLEQAQVQHAKEKQQLRESMSTSLHSTVSNSSTCTGTSTMSVSSFSSTTEGYINTAATNNTPSKELLDVFSPSIIERFVECPSSFDVIFRKGKSYGHHLGNSVFFKNLMESTFHEYRSYTTQHEKVQLTWRIVHEVVERRKGRFLDWDRSHNMWIHITDIQKMREKVAQSYKVYAKQQRRFSLATTNNTTSSSSSSQQQQQQQQHNQHQQSIFLNNTNNNNNNSNSCI